MAAAGNQPPGGFEWLAEFGVTIGRLRDLNPCVPGEFTQADSYYVNSATPRVIYRGSHEGTLPLVAGRWYLIPSDVVRQHPELTRDTVSLARAARLIRS